MNPPENQNQNGQPQPQPNASVTPPGPAGSNGAVPSSRPEQPSSPQAIYSGSMLSREEAEKQRKLEDKAEKKKKAKKRILISFPIVLVLAILIGSLIYAGIIPGLKFKTVTYRNGFGQQFKLKFYTKYSVGDFSAPLLPPEFGTPKQLASKKTIGDSYPLALTIIKLHNTPPAKLTECNGGIYSKVSSVKNTATGNTINLCSSSTNGIKSPLFYSAILIKSNSYYDVIFVPDLDYSKITPTVENASNSQQILQKINLPAYKSDVETILASIKPL